MKTKKINQRVISFLTIISLFFLFFPISPEQPVKLSSLEKARAATPGKFTDVTISASNYTVNTEFTLTATFTTANTLSSGDIIKIEWWDIQNILTGGEYQGTADSITVDGTPFGGVDSEMSTGTYLEWHLNSTIAAGSTIEIDVTGLKHYSYAMRAERVGLITYNPDENTLYDSCIDAGGGTPSLYGDCNPYWVFLPIGTPVVSGQLLGPLGSDDENNGVYSSSANIWNDTVYNNASTDHKGNFYIYELATASDYEMEFYTPLGCQYSEPENVSGISVTEGSTTDIGIVRYKLPSATGIIKDANGDPIENAYVRYMRMPMPDQATDSNGRFYLSAVSAGTYTVQFSSWGFEGSASMVVPDPIDITVDGVSTYDMGTIQFQEANKTIKGYVRYPDGRAVTDAQVGCSKPMGGDWKSTNVDGSGYYEVLVSKGHWMCFAEHVRGEKPEEDFDWVFFDQPDGITFTEDNSITENKTQNFEVSPVNSTITGQVLKPDGTVFNEGGINIDVYTMMGFGGWNQADSDGSFTVKVPAGTYQVMINVWHDDWGGPNPQTITISSNENRDLGTLYLTPKNATISGTITNTNGTGLNNQYIDCFVANQWGKWANGQTDSNGNFSLKAFGNATYQCMPMTDFGGYSSGSSAESYLYLGAPKSVNLPNINSTASNVDFEMARADATINVTTVDSNGDQVDTFGFAFVDRGGGTGMGGHMMDSGLGGPVNSGNATFKIPSSLCSASSCSINVSTPPGAGSEYSSAGPQSFTVSNNGTANVDVEMVPHNATIAGTLEDSDGNAITGVEANVFADNFEKMVFSDTMVNTTTGAYELTLAAGTYNIGAWVSPELGYVSCGLSETEVTAKANQTVTQDLTLCKNDATIDVTVLAPNGNPMSGAFVDASTSSGMREIDQGPGMMGPGPIMGPGMMGQMTNSDGTVSIGVPGGSGTTFYLSASLPPEMNYINPSKQTVSIASGQTKNITMQFRESDATISGSTTIDGNTTSAYITAWSESGGFTEAYSYSGSYNLNVTQGDNWHVNAKTKSGSDFYKSGEKVITVEEASETLDLTLSLAAANVPDPVSATFNANQPAVVALGDGSVTVNVPSSAISSESDDQIKVTISPNYEVPDTDTDKVPTYGAEITAYKNNTEVESQFNSNITVTQCWGEEQMSDMGLSDSDLSSKYWDEEAGAWKTPGTVSSDNDRNCQTSSVNHLTNFALTASEFSAPRLNITSPDDNSTVSVNSVTIEGTVSDTTASVNIAKDNKDTGTVNVNSSTGAFSHLVSGLSAGENVITVDASNGVGDAATVTLNITYEGSEEDDEIGIATGVEKELVLKADNGSSHIQVWDNAGNLKASFFAYANDFRGEMQISTGDLDGDGDKEIITAPGPGLAPHIRIFSKRGQLMGQFYAYDSSFRGGAEVKLADVDGDNIADIITKPKSGGGPNIRAYKWNASTSSFELIDWFMAYQSDFRGEVNLALADVTGDGNNNIIVTPLEEGGPNLRVYKYNSETASFELVDWFFVYHRGFMGGVNLVTADINGDGIKDIITSPYSAGGPNVRVYVYNSVTEQFNLLDYVMAYSDNYRGGVELKTVDVDSDGDNEIVTSPSVGGPHVRVFTYNSENENLELLDWLWVYPETYRIDFSTHVSDVDRDGNREITVVPQQGGPNVRVYEYSPETENFELADWFMAYANDFKGGVNLKVDDIDGDGDSDLVATPYSEGGPNVRIYKWNNSEEEMQIDQWFMGYLSSYRIGLEVKTIY